MPCVVNPLNVRDVSPLSQANLCRNCGSEYSTHGVPEKAPQSGSANPDLEDVSIGEDDFYLSRTAVVGYSQCATAPRAGARGAIGLLGTHWQHGQAILSRARPCCWAQP